MSTKTKQKIWTDAMHREMLPLDPIRVKKNYSRQNTFPKPVVKDMAMRTKFR